MKKMLIFLLVICFIPSVLFAKTFVLLDPNDSAVDSQKTIVESYTQAVQTHVTIAQIKALILKKLKTIQGLNSQKAALQADIINLLQDIADIKNDLSLDPNDS